MTQEKGRKIYERKGNLISFFASSITSGCEPTYFDEIPLKCKQFLERFVSNTGR
jgi:hypothetical protein